ncbi:MAG: cupin domain-containing protein [Gaiellaceae bacterium]
MSDDNVWSDEWESDDDWSGGGALAKRLPRGDVLGASVYELGPGNFVVYHFHHGAEEMMIVLHGTPTLRTPDGERELAEGEVVHFPRGPDGAHAVRNESDAPARFVMVSDRPSPEVAEYPDLGQITAQARTGSQTGERLWLIYAVPKTDA